MIHQGRETVGERTCGRIVAFDQLCGRVAVGHFLWTDEGDNGVACVAHTRWAMAHAVDYHPLGDDCTMPGVQWVYSTAVSAGRCEWPHEAASEDRVTEFAGSNTDG
jgi:hypothetical protein